MKPCALCLWTGSALPGGYSTVNMNTSFPGNSGRGLVISGVTTGSAAYTAATPSSRDNRRADFIFFPSGLRAAGGWSPGTRGSLRTTDSVIRDGEAAARAPGEDRGAWSRGGGCMLGAEPHGGLP